MMLIKEKFICENISRNESGELCLAGVSAAAMAKKYGTPLYLYDEERIRERCRTYLNAVSAALGASAKVLYASKAASFRRIYEIMKENNIAFGIETIGKIEIILLE